VDSWDFLRKYGHDGGIVDIKSDNPSQPPLKLRGRARLSPEDSAPPLIDKRGVVGVMMIR
jgi:hypothetical protein